MMLVLGMKLGEWLQIGEVKISVRKHRGHNQIKVAIDAPREIEIKRESLKTTNAQGGITKEKIC